MGLNPGKYGRNPVLLKKFTALDLLFMLEIVIQILCYSCRLSDCRFYRISERGEIISEISETKIGPRCSFTLHNSFFAQRGHERRKVCFHNSLVHCLVDMHPG